MASVLKRLDPALWADSGAQVKWLLALTRALLESQGELIKETRRAHLGMFRRERGCPTCDMIASAERLQKGEV